MKKKITASVRNGDKDIMVYLQDGSSHRLAAGESITAPTITSVEADRHARYTEKKV
jgi:hypothetical protein